MYKLYVEDREYNEFSVVLSKDLKPIKISMAQKNSNRGK